MSKFALMFICTGAGYHKFIEPAVASAKKYFLPQQTDILLFTDSERQYDVAKQVKVPHLGWPNVTWRRFHTFLGEEAWLSQHDFLWYMDVDSEIVAPVGEEILSDGITATIHTSFILSRGTYCTPEENPRSAACLSKKDIRKMYTGMSYGGTSAAFLALCRDCATIVDIDTKNNFVPIWHDESVLNKYLYDHPPAKELGEDYNAWNRTPNTKVFRVPKPGAPNRPAVNGVQPPDPRNA